MTARYHRLLIPLAALLVCAPLLLYGPSCGHDFDFHLLSWLEAATQLTHGAFPHWAFTPAWNAGEPRFLFYPPLSWLLGATLGLILPWPLVPAAFTFLTLTLAGFTMHHLARAHVDAPRATVAAVLYVTNPYMLFTAYERTAYGELLAAAFIPLLLAAVLAPSTATPRPRLLPIALPLALIWLSNAPAGVMATYALALLTLVRLSTKTGCPIHDSPTVISRLLPKSTRPRLHLALTTIAATGLGLALASAYLIPAITEQPLISTQLATVEGMRITDNFPFHPMSATAQTPPADAALHNAVLAQATFIWEELLCAIALSPILILLTRPAKDALAFPFVPLLLLTVVITLLMTPLSASIWAHLPEMRFLQFPWRLLALLAPVYALLFALALPAFRPHPIALLIVLLAPSTIILHGWQDGHQPCDAEDNIGARVALFHSPQGTEPTDEYTPATTDGDQVHPGNPPYWLAPSAEAPAPANTPPGPAPTDLTLTLPHPADLILNRRAYPLWQVTLNGQPAPLATLRDDGLISVALPAGPNRVQLQERRTPDENAGLALTLTAGCLSLALWRRQRQSAKIAK